MNEADYIRVSTMAKIYIARPVLSELIKNLQMLGDDYEGEVADLQHAYEALDAAWDRLYLWRQDLVS